MSELPDGRTLFSVASIRALRPNRYLQAVQRRAAARWPVPPRRATQSPALRRAAAVRRNVGNSSPPGVK